MECVNPKSEYRNPKQTRSRLPNSKSKTEDLTLPSAVCFGICVFEHLDLFRISDLEFRIYFIRSTALSIARRAKTVAM
jgi:hypothetical protein